MYAKLKRIAKQLADAFATEGYWSIEEEFKAELRSALADKPAMAAMNKRQLLQVIAWCSSHRPHEPHAILTAFSLLNDHVKS